MREPEAERRRVGLERRVGPVALILHLELVALEREVHGQPRRQVDGKLVEGPRGRKVDAVHQRLRHDRVREDALGRPGLAGGSIATAPEQLGEMQHAEADAAVAERAGRGAVHLVAERAVRAALDAAPPLEVERVGHVASRERDRERVVVPIDAQARRCAAGWCPSARRGRRRRAGAERESRPSRRARDRCPWRSRRERSRPQRDRRRWSVRVGAAQEFQADGAFGARRRIARHRAGAASCDRIQRSSTTSR